MSAICFIDVQRYFVFLTSPSLFTTDFAHVALQRCMKEYKSRE